MKSSVFLLNVLKLSLAYSLAVNILDIPKLEVTVSPSNFLIASLSIFYSPYLSQYIKPTVVLNMSIYILNISMIIYSVDISSIFLIYVPTFLLIDSVTIGILREFPIKDINQKN